MASIRRGKFRFLLLTVVAAAFAGAGLYAYHVFNNLTPEQALTQRLDDVKPGMTGAEVDAIFGKPDGTEDLHRPGVDGSLQRKTWKSGRASVEVEFIAGHAAFKHARTQYDFPRQPTTR